MIIISLVMSSYNLSMYCPFVQQTWVFFLKEWCILLFSMAYISSFCLLPLPTLMENSVPRSWAWWFLLVEKIIYIRYKDMLLSCMLCVHYFRTQFSSQAIYTPSWCYARNVENLNWVDESWRKKPTLKHHFMPPTMLCSWKMESEDYICKF